MEDRLTVKIGPASPLLVPESATLEELNADPELNRAVASTAFQLFTDITKIAMEAASATARWLLTVIVAINGGAAVAVGGIPMSPGFKVAAVCAFIAGILSALGASVAVLATLPALLNPIGEATRYWLEVKHDGERIVGDYEVQQREMDAAASKAAVWSWSFGIVSVVLFVIGSVLAAAGVLSAHG